MSVFLNTKFGFVAKVSKRAAAVPKGYVKVAESFTPDLRRAYVFTSFSNAQIFAKENAFEYWAVVNPCSKELQAL